MDLKCLLKLLLEKGYVKEIDSHKNRRMETVFKNFECEIAFEEIYEKIKNSEYNEKEIVITTDAYYKNRFCILNLINFEHELIDLGEGTEKFGFRGDHRRMSCFSHQILSIIKERMPRFRVLEYSFDMEMFLKLEDLVIKKERLEKEKKKENEVIDFLDKLP